MAESETHPSPHDPTVQKTENSDAQKSVLLATTS